MTKYANESKAWARAAAYVIFKGARHVATIHIAYPADGAGRLYVTCRQTGKAAERSAAVRAKLGWKGKDAEAYAQHGSAGGWGYDKKTAALSGIVIDGHELTDHCGRNKKPPRGMAAWPRDAKPPRGWRFANWSAEKQGWADCYRTSGLDYLRALGYTVVDV